MPLPPLSSPCSDQAASSEYSSPDLLPSCYDNMVYHKGFTITSFSEPQRISRQANQDLGSLLFGLGSDRLVLLEMRGSKEEVVFPNGI